MLGRLMMDRLMMERQSARSRVVSLALCPLLLALLPLLTACGIKEREPPPYEANPSPKEAYEVVITTHDAPEEMFITATSVDFEIADEACLPPIDNVEGVRYGLEKYSLPIQLTRLDSTTFAGVYYRDGLKVANYFGRGDCKWKFTGINANLRMPSTGKLIYFSIGATPETGAQTRFAEKSIKPVFDDGQAHPAAAFSQERFEREIPTSDKDNFFSYTISINTRKYAK